MLIELTTFTIEIDNTLFMSIGTTLLSILTALLAYIRYSVLVKKRTLNSISKIDIIQNDIVGVKSDVLKIQEKLDNNIYETLFDVLRETASNELGFENESEVGLWKFFKINIKDIRDAYYQLKKSGLDLLKSETFVNNLLSSPVPELRGCFSEERDGRMYTYPKVFITFVVETQLKMWCKFVEDVKIDLATIKDKDSIWEIVKSNAKDSFKIMVIKVINKFHETKHLIGNNENGDVSLNKDIIRTLIAEDYIEQAIKLIFEFYQNNEKAIDMMTVVSNRYKQYKKEVILDKGIKETTLPRITYSLLEILNTY